MTTVAKFKLTESQIKKTGCCSPK